LLHGHARRNRPLLSLSYYVFLHFGGSSAPKDRLSWQTQFQASQGAAATSIFQQSMGHPLSGNPRVANAAVTPHNLATYDELKKDPES